MKSAPFRRGRTPGRWEVVPVAAAPGRCARAVRYRSPGCRWSRPAVRSRRAGHRGSGQGRHIGRRCPERSSPHHRRVLPRDVHAIRKGLPAVRERHDRGIPVLRPVPRPADLPPGLRPLPTGSPPSTRRPWRIRSRSGSGPPPVQSAAGPASRSWWGNASPNAATAKAGLHGLAAVSVVAIPVAPGLTCRRVVDIWLAEASRIPRDLAVSGPFRASHTLLDISP